MNRRINFQRVCWVFKILEMLFAWKGKGWSLPLRVRMGHRYCHFGLCIFLCFYPYLSLASFVGALFLFLPPTPVYLIGCKEKRRTLLCKWKSEEEPFRISAQHCTLNAGHNLMDPVHRIYSYPLDAINWQLHLGCSIVGQVRSGPTCLTFACFGY